jgi:hypothetical protein
MLNRHSALTEQYGTAGAEASLVKQVHGQMVSGTRPY